MSVETTRPASPAATDTDGAGSDGGAPKPARGGMFTALANRRRRDEWLARRIAELDPEEREVLRRAVGILEKVNHA